MVKLGAGRRAEFLLETADVMRRRRFELAAWEVFECGKAWREADGDVCEAIDFCEYYARAAHRARPAARKVDVPGEENRLLYIAARCGGDHRPLEFPAGDSDRHDHCRAGDGQHGGHQAVGAIERRGRQADGNLSARSICRRAS